jgi:predicted O-methyltransferase YrrM
MSYLFCDDGPLKTGRKVCLATTVYENPDASYTFSIQRSRQALAEAGIQSAYMLLTGNCHVDDARNHIVQEFLLTDCDALVFLDADVSWEPWQLVRLCQSNNEIVGGVYPYRRDDKPGEMPVRMMEGDHVRVVYEATGYLEVEGLPTGFMKIEREVLERMTETCAQHYRGSDRRSMVPILFERTFVDGTRWGGDLAFCNRWRNRYGGRIYALPDLRLGHVAKTILKGSLSATIRRREGKTLSYICEAIAKGKPTLDLLTEAREYVANPYGALEENLALVIETARNCGGDIIEAGSGLSTVLMAAANSNHTVYCLEHHGLYQAQLKQMAAEAGVENIGLCKVPVTDGWYDLSDMQDLPGRFAMGVNDGPPRQIGSRMGFYKHLGDRCDIIVADDMDDDGYLIAARDWARSSGRELTFLEPRSALIGPVATREAAE